MPRNPGFRITRRASTDGVEFDPPRGSDELCDALEAAYPDEKTIYQRRRRAIIDFYVGEKEAEDRRNSSVVSESPELPTQHPFPNFSFHQPSPLRTESESLSDHGSSKQQELILEPLVRSPKRKYDSNTIHSQLQALGEFNFKLSVKDNVPKARAKKRKTQQRPDVSTKRIPACDTHHDRKRKCPKTECSRWREQYGSVPHPTSSPSKPTVQQPAESSPSVSLDPSFFGTEPSSRLTVATKINDASAFLEPPTEGFALTPQETNGAIHNDPFTAFMSFPEDIQPLLEAATQPCTTTTQSLNISPARDTIVEWNDHFPLEELDWTNFEPPPDNNLSSLNESSHDLPHLGLIDNVMEGHSHLIESNQEPIETGYFDFMSGSATYQHRPNDSFYMDEFTMLGHETGKQVFAEQWNPTFLARSPSISSTAWVASKRQNLAEKDGFGLFFRDYDDALSSSDIEEVERFCQGTSLEDLQSTDLVAGSNRAAWLDARAFSRNEIEGSPSRYRSPLTAASLYTALKEPQLSHDDLADANRRVIYIHNSVRNFLLEHAETASPHLGASSSSGAGLPDLRNLILGFQFLQWPSPTDATSTAPTRHPRRVLDTGRTNSDQNYRDHRRYWLSAEHSLTTITGDPLVQPIIQQGRVTDRLSTVENNDRRSVQLLLDLHPSPTVAEMTTLHIATPGHNENFTLLVTGYPEGHLLVLSRNGLVVHIPFHEIEQIGHSVSIGGSQYRSMLDFRGLYARWNSPGDITGPLDAWNCGTKLCRNRPELDDQTSMPIILNEAGFGTSFWPVQQAFQVNQFVPGDFRRSNIAYPWRRIMIRQYGSGERFQDDRCWLFEVFANTASPHEVWVEKYLEAPLNDRCPSPLITHSESPNILSGIGFIIWSFWSLSCMARGLVQIFSFFFVVLNWLYQRYSLLLK